MTSATVYQSYILNTVLFVLNGTTMINRKQIGQFALTNIFFNSFDRRLYWTSTFSNKQYCYAVIRLLQIQTSLSSVYFYNKIYSFCNAVYSIFHKLKEKEKYEIVRASPNWLYMTGDLTEGSLKSGLTILNIQYVIYIKKWLVD